MPNLDLGGKNQTRETQCIFTGTVNQMQCCHVVKNAHRFVNFQNDL